MVSWKVIIKVTHSVSHILDPSDKLLSELEVVIDRSDVEYREIMKELKTKMFRNRC